MSGGGGTRGRLAGWVAVVLVAGCAAPMEPETEGLCVAYMHFDGAMYVIESVVVEGTRTPAGIVGEVERNLGCNDTPDAGGPLTPLVTPRDGDSNFLAPGTKIHAVDGYPPSQRLAVRPDTVWIFMERWPG